MSEPPVAFIREPTATDSDEDLVPNKQQRKRRNNPQKTSQPPPKRQKTSQNVTVAGGTRAPSSHTVPRISQAGSSAPKVHKSRPSEIPLGPSRTKVVKRTMKEKRRQRSSSSSSESVSIPSLLKNGAALPSASAPPPRQNRAEFERPTLKDRFGIKTQYLPSAPPKSGISNNEEIIDLVSDEEPSTSQRKPVTSIDSHVIELSDSSDAESHKVVQRSARRKAEKRMGATAPQPKPPEVFLIEDSDDERSTSKKIEAAPSELARVGKSSNLLSPKLGISNEGMDVQSDGARSPRPVPDSHISTPPPEEDSIMRGVSPVLPSAHESFSSLEVVVPGEDSWESSLLQDTDNNTASATLEQPDAASSVPLPDNSLDFGGTEDVSLDNCRPVPERIGVGTSKTPPSNAVPASRHPSPPASPSLPAPQPDLLLDGSHSEPSLPDHTLSGSAVAVQQQANSIKTSDGLPKLDLITWRAKHPKKRRLPPRESTTSTSTAEKLPLNPDSRPQSNSPGGPFLASRKLKQWDQDSPVQAIITGQHNAQVSQIGRSSPVEEMQVTSSAQQVEGLSPRLSIEEMEQSDHPNTEDVEVPSIPADEPMENTSRQLSPDPLVLVSPPHFPPSVPPPSSPPIILAEQPSTIPVKQEDPLISSGPGVDREVIDLTRSDDEHTIQRSVKTGDLRHFNRMRKLMGMVGMKVSVSPSSLVDVQRPTGEPVDAPKNGLPRPTDGPSMDTFRIPSTVSLVEGVAKMDLHDEDPLLSDVNHTPATVLTPTVGVHEAGVQPPSSPPQERRSYDDAEVYHLEYIGPPSVTSSPGPDSEEEAVQNLIVPVFVGQSPARQNMVESNLWPVSDDGTSSEDGRDAFLVASGDEDSTMGASRPSTPRRSSRSSSRSLSEDSANVGVEEDNSDFNSPMSTLSLDLPQVDLADHGMPQVKNATPYPVTTWKSYREDLTKTVFPVRWASDLVSKLHDYINSYDDGFRASPHMRQVFESTIRENTAEDEPDAPLIEVTNEVDADPAPPWEFYYSNQMWLGDGIDPPDVTKLVGCDCKGKCDPKSETCSCLKRQAPYYKDQDVELFPSGFAYDGKGRLRTITSSAPVFECNALCSCDDEECMNRVVQHGRRVSVALRKTEHKGWGVFATKKIVKGTFVGVYAGEFLRDDECERRGLVYDKSGRTYLLDIDFYYLQKARENPKSDSSLECQYVVDAYHVGNFTRFLNNSCDPNCRVIPCYINEPDINKPLMTMFARRDVAPGEELCFSYYGRDPDNPDDDEQVERTGRDGIKNECRCGAEGCVGFMFG